jgi:hypothetical protein
VEVEERPYCPHPPPRAVQVRPNWGMWRDECLSKMRDNRPWPLRVGRRFCGEVLARRPGCPGAPHERDSGMRHRARSIRGRRPADLVGHLPSDAADQLRAARRMQPEPGHG